MTIRPVTIIGEPVLHRPTAPVTAFDADLLRLVQDMHETMDAAHGVGLAAPQIGVGLRLFTYVFADQDDAPPRGTVVNPRLVLGKISEENPDPEEDSEGCLSVPGYSFPLRRAEWVRVIGQDEQGRPLDFEAHGWFARIMQHETQHLDGALYVDRLNKKWAGRAKKAARREGWGVPSLTWMPGQDKDPFGHDDAPEEERADPRASEEG